MKKSFTYKKKGRKKNQIPKYNIYNFKKLIKTIYK